MVSPSVHLRLSPKLLKILQAESKRRNISVPGLINQILKAKYTRKARARPRAFEDYFAGKPRRKIKSFEDYFSEKR